MHPPFKAISKEACNGAGKALHTTENLSVRNDLYNRVATWGRNNDSQSFHTAKLFAFVARQCATAFVLVTDSRAIWAKV
jgi:hypothetical protein